MAVLQNRCVVNQQVLAQILAPVWRLLYGEDVLLTSWVWQPASWSYFEKLFCLMAPW